MSDLPSNEWHGYHFGDTKLHIGPLPGRKSVALYMYDGGAIVVVAWFVSVEAARKTLAAIDELVGLKTNDVPYVS